MPANSPFSTFNSPFANERATQQRVIALFRDELGYRYLGDWTDRDGNSNIEERLLTTYLTRGVYTPEQIRVAFYKLRTEADNHSRSLYGNNQAVYNLLRYGVPVKIEAGKVTETVHLINWQKPEQNDFAIAEEVTLRGNRERRPDIVLYVNGIAVGVLELKNSRVSIGDGIRQSISNQRSEFNEGFFSTVQFIFAGNDSEGLRYGAIGTPEKYFLTWREDVRTTGRSPLYKYLLKMCCKERLIELMYDFVLFDGGIKKLPRVHQYFGIKAAQEHVKRRPSVYPPSGRVRISAPSRLDLDTIRVFAISKLGWIKQQQKKLQEQERETPREYLDRESHYVWGKRYLLRVIESDAAPSVTLHHSRMLLRVRSGTDAKKKRAIVEAWYRQQLKNAVPPLITRWEPLLGVKIERFFVQRMTTQWGSCNHNARTIRLNTELAKKPQECLDYIVMHEIAHILEPTHNARFIALMDQFMPTWLFYRDQLNRFPVSHEDWAY
jgi:predicted metal-dependent hydrolase